MYINNIYIYYKMVNIVKDLSVKHVLIFVIIAFLLYYIIGNCGYRDGFSVGIQVDENMVTYIYKFFNPDKCNPKASWQETFKYDCTTIRNTNNMINTNNNYIYDLYNKYKELEFDYHNYKLTNGNNTEQSKCYCDVTGKPGSDRRFGEDIENCGSPTRHMCDCLYSDKEIVKDNKTLKTGTCTIKGQYFNATEINRPPVNPNK